MRGGEMKKALALVVVITSTNARAAVGLAGWYESFIPKNMPSLAVLVLSAFAIAGLVLVGLGLKEIANGRTVNDSRVHPYGMVIGGILLFSLVAVISIATGFFNPASTETHSILDWEN